MSMVQSVALRRFDPADTAFRVTTTAVIGWFAWRLGGHWLQNPEEITTLLLVVSEITSLVLLATSYRPSHRDDSAFYCAISIAAAFMVPLFIEAEPDHGLVPDGYTAFLTALGLVWVIWAKISLGRAFGIVAAARVLRDVGPYRLVRHPIYAGYLIGHVAFLAANFTFNNALVLALLYNMQILRLLREEKVMAENLPGYAAYMGRVRWRLCPGLF